MVFQNYALYPTMTVAAEYAGLLLRNAGVSRADTRKQARRRRDPAAEGPARTQASQLSGGQRQRVAMGGRRAAQGLLAWTSRCPT